MRKPSQTSASPEAAHAATGAQAPGALEIPADELHARALLALRQGRFDIAEGLLAGGEVDRAALVESLRIYQAELEIQNEELQRSYHQTQLALTRFMTFFNTLPIAELVIDRQGLIKEANGEARRLFGLRDTSYHQYFFIRLIEERDRGAAIHALTRVRPGEAIDVHELNFRTKTAGPFIGDLHMAFLPADPEGGPLIICAISDRTEAAQQREALRESRERYRIIAEFSSDWEYWIDPNARYRYVSPACLGLTGYPAEAFLADPELFRRLIHPDDQHLWDQHIRAHLKDEGAGTPPLELRVRHLDGQEYWIAHSCTPVYGEAGDFLGRRGVNRDITELKRSREQLSFLAQHDPLTGLPNRVLFRERLDQAVQRAIRSRGHVALLFLDLDRFKIINDTLGHSTGDILLQQVATRLSQQSRATDTVARLGGDEFVVISEDVRRPTDAAALAQRLLDSVQKPFEGANRSLYLSLSIGISVYPSDSTDVDALISHADIAMYRAKGAGRNGFCFFEQAMSDSAAERLRMEQELHRALDQDELFLEYQPQVSLLTGQPVGVEVLCRWRHPRLGILAPERFLPLAQEIGLLDQVDAWVLEHACQQLAQWDRKGRGIQRLAINVSLRAMQRADIVDKIQDSLSRSGIAPDRLEFELVESALMDRSPTTTANLERLGALGIKLAVDDFGSGCSPLILIKRLPIQRLKIDQVFVAQITTSADAAAVIRAAIDLARNFGLCVLAEGVESPEQAAYLAAAGCEEAQGFLYGQPIGAEQWSERPAAPAP